MEEKEGKVTLERIKTLVQFNKEKIWTYWFYITVLIISGLHRFFFPSFHLDLVTLGIVFSFVRYSFDSQKIICRSVFIYRYRARAFLFLCVHMYVSYVIHPPSHFLTLINVFFFFQLAIRRHPRIEAL